MNSSNQWYPKAVAYSKAIRGKAVDFGASDAPLSSDQFKACNGCVQIPWALSATSVIYNLDGAKNLLHMDGPTLARIFSGEITQWNDPAIAKLNKGVNLPSTKIAIVHRSDNSGTTYNFTEYLSSVSAKWKSTIGKGVAVNWPGGAGARGRPPRSPRRPAASATWTSPTRSRTT